MDMHAVMVTNTDVYDLTVRGQLVNNTWTNIGFRFEAYIDSASLPYTSRYGLEVKLFAVFLLTAFIGTKFTTLKVGATRCGLV